MESLPSELLLYISTFLLPKRHSQKPRDISALSQTCKGLYSVARPLMYRSMNRLVYFCACEQDISWEKSAGDLPDNEQTLHEIYLSNSQHVRYVRAHAVNMTEIGREKSCPEPQVLLKSLADYPVINRSLTLELTRKGHRTCSRSTMSIECCNSLCAYITPFSNIKSLTLTLPETAERTWHIKFIRRILTSFLCLKTLNLMITLPTAFFLDEFETELSSEQNKETACLENLYFRAYFSNTARPGSTSSTIQGFADLFRSATICLKKLQYLLWIPMSFGYNRAQMAAMDNISKEWPRWDIPNLKILSLHNGLVDVTLFSPTTLASVTVVDIHLAIDGSSTSGERFFSQVRAGVPWQLRP